jgi:hypothetical protein
MHYHPGRPDPDHPEIHGNYGPEAAFAVRAEAGLPTTMHEREIARGLELGLQGADSIVDRTIPTFSRGELPHFAGINTFLKAPYVEDVRRCGEYDVAVLGAPFDGGTTYRSGTRFGPQGIRKISTGRTASNWASTCARRSPSPTWATSSPSRATSRRRSTRSPRRCRTSTRAARSRWCWAGTTPSATRPPAASRPI